MRSRVSIDRQTKSERGAFSGKTTDVVGFICAGEEVLTFYRTSLILPSYGGPDKVEHNAIQVYVTNIEEAKQPHQEQLAVEDGVCKFGGGKEYPE